MEGIRFLQETLLLYEKASCAHVMEENDTTHSAWWIEVGQEGLKVLVVFWGVQAVMRGKNWEGVKVKV